VPNPTGVEPDEAREACEALDIASPIRLIVCCVDRQGQAARGQFDDVEGTIAGDLVGDVGTVNRLGIARVRNVTHRDPVCRELTLGALAIAAPPAFCTLPGRGVLAFWLTADRSQTAG
jgi:hypothetical protein